VWVTVAAKKKTYRKIGTRRLINKCKSKLAVIYEQMSVVVI